MKKLKLAAIAIISLILLTNVIQAQELNQKPINKEAKKQAKVDEKQLGLLVGQQEPYRQIIQKHDKETQKILDSYSNEKERNEKMKEADEARNKELKSLLTEDQYNKYLKLEAENMQEIKKETKNKTQ